MNEKLDKTDILDIISSRFGLLSEENIVNLFNNYFAIDNDYERLICTADNEFILSTD